MTNNEHEGMKKCTKCGEWKPATAEYFNRNKTRTDGLRAVCKECCLEYYQKNKECCLERVREYRQKNKEEIAERNREYYKKNRDHFLEYYREYNREYYQKNKDRILEDKREYEQSPVGRLSGAIRYLREKTGATIYLRDMTDEEKETLANQYVAVRTLEKTEKELLAASGKKRCPACDRVLDYGCFFKSTTSSGGVYHWCRECAAEYKREYRQQNKDKINEHKRKYRQQKKQKST